MLDSLFQFRYNSSFMKNAIERGNSHQLQAEETIPAPDRFSEIPDRVLANYPSTLRWSSDTRKSFTTIVGSLLTVIDRIYRGDWEKVLEKDAFIKVGGVLIKAGASVPVDKESEEPDIPKYITRSLKLPPATP